MFKCLNVIYCLCLFRKKYFFSKPLSFKVLNDDETMLVELRNSVRSRNSLRSKHLAQLEASKEKLNEIKTFATQKLIGMDQDLPINEDGKCLILF